MPSYLSRSVLADSQADDQRLQTQQASRDVIQARAEAEATPPPPETPPVDWGGITKGLLAQWPGGDDQSAQPDTSAPAMPGASRLSQPSADTQSAPASGSSALDWGGLTRQLQGVFGQLPAPPAPPDASPSPSAMPGSVSRQPGLTSGPPLAASVGRPAAPAAAVSTPAAAPAGPSVAIDNSSRASFARTAYPAALSAAGGDPELAKRLIASAISENGTVGGGGDIGVGFNFGGIKYDPQSSGSGSYGTWESEGGQRVNQNAGFAHYDSPEAGFAAIPRFIQTNFPKQWAQYQADHNAAALYKAINVGGYATDPQWSSTIEGIAAQQVAPAIAGASTGPPPTPGEPGGPPLATTYQSLPTATAPSRQQALTSGPTSSQGQFSPGSYTPNQISAATSEGLDYETALAVCGPAAAIAFARKTGRNPTMQEAVGLARQVGWTSAQGMAGPASEQKLLGSMGVASRLVDGVPDWGAVAADVQNGNPVIISTPGHYFVAEQYDPASGKFNFGNSTAILKAAHGQTWFTPEEMASLGMGAPRGSLFMDSPATPAPSVVAGASNTAATSSTPQMQALSYKQPLIPTSGPDTFPTDALTGDSASAPAPAPPTPGAGAWPTPSFQDDQSQSGWVQPDMAPGPPVPAAPPSPPAAPTGSGWFPGASSLTQSVTGALQPVSDAVSNIPGAITSGLGAARDALGSIRDAAPTVADRARGITPTGETPLQAAAGAIGAGVEESMQPGHSLLDAPAKLQGTTSADEGDLPEVPEPYRSAALTARRAGFQIMTLAMPTAVAEHLWTAAGLPNVNIAGFEINPGMFLVPVPSGIGGTLENRAAGGITAGAVNRIPDVAGAIENAGSRATGAVRSAIGTGVGGIRSALEGNAARVAALDAERAGQASVAAPGVLGVAPETAQVADTAASDTSRFYHGTSSAFEQANADTFSKDGLYGPGYYLTDNPEVASSYANDRAYAPGGITPQANLRASRLQDDIAQAQRILDDPRSSGEDRAWYTRRLADSQAELDRVTRQGPNVRPLDVPNDLNLLDVREPAPESLIGPVNTMREAAGLPPLRPGATGNDLYYGLQEAYPTGSLRAVNTFLQDRGIDGIAHSGGLIRPLTDAGGQPIQHEVNVIFPDALPRIRQAYSGDYGGAALGQAPAFPGQRPTGSGFFDRATPILSQGVASAISGGVGAATADQLGDPNDPNRRLKGFVAGAAVPFLASRGARALARRAGAVADEGLPGALGTLGQAPNELGRIPRQARAAEVQLPINLTDAEQVARIRLDKFPAEMHDELLNAARGTNFGERLRRGVLPDQTVQDLAAEYAPTVDAAIRAGRRGRAYSAEEVVGLRNLMVQQTQKVNQLSDRIAAGTLPMSGQTAALAQLTLERQKLGALGEIAFGGAPAEAGRALRQFRQTAQDLKEDPSGAGMRYLRQQFGTFDKASEVAANYQQMVDAGADPVQLASFLRNAKGGWLNRLNILRYASMLSSSTTHAMNATGNLIMQGLDVVAGPIAATMDVGRSAITGAPREVFYSETPARLAGMAASAQQALADAAFIMKHGMRPEDVTKLDQLHQGFGTNIPGIAPSGSKAAAAVDFIAEGPLRSLSAADAIFRGTSLGGHLAAEATADAMRANGGRPVTAAQLQASMAKPEVAARAEELAKRSVLQEDRKTTSAVNMMIRNLPPEGQAIVTTAVPFIKTPYNLVAQGVGMTPAGAVGLIRDIRAGKAPREIEQRASKIALGTAVMGVAAWQNLDGNLTGPYPESDAERSTLPPGWRPWSYRAKFPNGQVQYIPLALAGPLAVPAVVAILATEAAKKGQPLTPETAAHIALGIGQYAADQTFLQGVSQLSAVLDKGGTQAENYVEGIASQFSPHFLGGGALGRQIQQVMNMPQRDPHGAIEALLATHPATAGLVPPKRDVLGRPQATAPGGLETALAPFRASVEKDAPVIAAFREGKLSLPMAPPKDYANPDDPTGPRMPLTRGQQATWQTEFGQALQEGWQSAGMPTTETELRKVEQQARDRALRAASGR